MSHAIHSDPKNNNKAALLFGWGTKDRFWNPVEKLQSAQVLPRWLLVFSSISRGYVSYHASASNAQFLLTNIRKKFASGLIYDRKKIFFFVKIIDGEL